VTDFDYSDVPSQCDECLKSIVAMAHWAKVPEEDLAKDRHQHDWPSLPLRRVIICRECFRTPGKRRWQRFAGLDTSPWALVRRLDEDETYAYCATCGRQTILRGRFCSQWCADRAGVS
jgi:hypothetical protein